MHTEISYRTIEDRKARDAKAIEDIIEWFNRKPILFGDLVQLATHIEHEIPSASTDGTMRKQTIEGLNMTLSFGGVEGYPFHAFCRRYCPKKYREWMTSGDDAVELDDDNFTVG